MPAAKNKKASPGSRQRSAKSGLEKVSLIPETSADHAPAALPEKKSENGSSAPKPDPISTSPKAMQAYELMKILDPLVGVSEASFFMQRANNLLGGATPVAAIKEGRIDEVKRAVQAVAMLRGVFAEPWLPPKTRR
jgi:hypothetical protein